MTHTHMVANCNIHAEPFRQTSDLVVAPECSHEGASVLCDENGSSSVRERCESLESAELSVFKSLSVIDLCVLESVKQITRYKSGQGLRLSLGMIYVPQVSDSASISFSKSAKDSARRRIGQGNGSLSRDCPGTDTERHLCAGINNH